MTQTTTEAVARIIDPSRWAALDSYLADMRRKLAGKDAGYDPDSFKDKDSLAKAAAIMALPDLQPGEEFLEFKEALSDLRSLRHEYECLNGGGPGWSARNKTAWAKVDELFASEDEAAYDRQQSDAHG